MPVQLLWLYVCVKGRLFFTNPVHTNITPHFKFHYNTLNRPAVDLILLSSWKWKLCQCKALIYMSVTTLTQWAGHVFQPQLCYKCLSSTSEVHQGGDSAVEMACCQGCAPYQPVTHRWKMGLCCRSDASKAAHPFAVLTGTQPTEFFSDPGFGAKSPWWDAKLSLKSYERKKHKYPHELPSCTKESPCPVTVLMTQYSLKACAYDLHKKLCPQDHIWPSDERLDFSGTLEFLLKAVREIMSSAHLKFKPFTQESKYGVGLLFYHILAFVLGCRKANMIS